MQIGDTVRVLPPFNVSFPDTYVIEGVSEAGAWQICGGCDFDEIYLELVP